MKKHHDDATTSIRKSYTALICADGRILPITESIGRRVLREIDPAGREGRALLTAGKVTLWTSDGKPHQKLKLSDMLREMKRDLDRKLSAAPRDPRVGALYRNLARSVSRARARRAH